MSASTPPPPTSGNGKYVIVAVLLLLGIVALAQRGMVAEGARIVVEHASSDRSPALEEGGLSFERVRLLLDV